ncbi:LOW QUALITY PROTEIN: hypothetical protein Cgig2_031015 [Carnegiea gigantea]|uniref:Uncharacterized protein n=1 Tax=Carnegiea gigantea TaxID=171969 RepID=A0A9Q1QL94_9CARY|nr:LOW QUALITY PROTEIN: hypothetical protein Cgig2_031015 [Carnegiea gigantea]
MSGHNRHSNEDIGWHFGIAIDGTHETGNVASCPDVINEIKRDMMKLLQDYKEKKRQKIRIEEEDAQLAHARYQSLEQHQFEHDQWVYRASRGTCYDEGGISRPPSIPQMHRSATVQETSSRGSRDMAYKQMSAPAAKLRVVELEFEKDRTRTKQSKVNSSWLKAGKKKMIKAFGSWVIDINVPFTMVDSVYTNPSLKTVREISPDVRAPSLFELLDKIFLIPNTCIDKVKIGKTGRLEPDVDKQIEAMRQVFLYKDRMNSFGSSIAERPIISLIVDQQPQDIQSSDCESEGHCHFRVVMVEAEVEEMEETEVQMRWITLLIVVVVSLLKMTEEVDVLRISNQENRHKLIVVSEKEPVQPHGYPTDAMYGYAGFQEVTSSFIGPGLFAPSGGYNNMTVS